MSDTRASTASTADTRASTAARHLYTAEAEAELRSAMSDTRASVASTAYTRASITSNWLDQPELQSTMPELQSSMPETGSPSYRGHSSMRDTSACVAAMRSKADARAVAFVASAASVACLADSCQAARERTVAPETRGARRESVSFPEILLEKVDRQLHPPVS